MIRIYILVVIIMALGGVGYAAKYYYDTTQATIATLRENNAKLEGAVETAEASIASLQQNAAKMQELNTQLAADLQKAEAYGDELRGKLSRMNLVQDALKDAAELEGKMNGATAKLWREIIADTGGTPDPNLPQWLQPREQAGAGDQGSNEDRKDNNTDGIETEASTAN